MNDAAHIDIPTDDFAGFIGFRDQLPLGGAGWQGESCEDKTEQTGFH
jgi:hypothetical protein